jgi:hypothetical protein
MIRHPLQGRQWHRLPAGDWVARFELAWKTYPISYFKTPFPVTLSEAKGLKNKKTRFFVPLRMTNL